MSFEKPDLQTLIERIGGDIEGQLPGTDALLRRNILRILGRAQAGAAHGLYGHQEWIAEQVFPDSAESTYLERWSAIWGVQRKSAAAAKGTVTITGTDGDTLPAGSTYGRSDGAQFTTDADATIAAGTADVAVTASTAGSAGNTSAAVTLTLTNPVAGINSDATVDAAGLTGGTDTETDAELLTRLLQRIQNPPAGGTQSDYERWALEVSGVTRAWVYPGELGAGTVTVRIVNDDANPIIPPQSTVDAVQTYLDSKRLVTSKVFVYAPVALPLDFTIQAVPNTAAVQAAITAELTDLILREGAPGGTLLFSHIDEAIAVASGVTDHKLVTPGTDLYYSPSAMPVLGTITWQ